METLFLSPPDAQSYAFAFPQSQFRSMTRATNYSLSLSMTFSVSLQCRYDRFSGSMGSGLGRPQKSHGLNRHAPACVRPNQYVIAYGIRRGRGGKSLPPWYVLSQQPRTRENMSYWVHVSGFGGDACGVLSGGWEVEGGGICSRKGGWRLGTHQERDPAVRLGDVFAFFPTCT